MSFQLGDYLKAINQTKQNIIRESGDPKAATDYPQFMSRRLLSYHKDVIFDVNEINCIPNLDPQLEFEYFLHQLPKKKRFGKTIRAMVPEHLALVKRFYNYSDEKALGVLALHTEEDFARMERDLNEGGVIK